LKWQGMVGILDTGIWIGAQLDGINGICRNDPRELAGALGYQGHLIFSVQ
jgi:hypothetical protein